MRLCTKCTANRLDHLWFFGHDIFPWKSSIWLPTANLPERAAGARHRRWRMWRTQVLRAPLWSLLWPWGRGGTPDEDQQLPVLLSPTKDRRPPVWLANKQRDSWVSCGTAARGDHRTVAAISFLFSFVCLSSFFSCLTSCCSKHVTCLFVERDYTICHVCPTKRGHGRKTHGDKSHKRPKLPYFRYPSLLEYISLCFYILSERRMFSIFLYTECRHLLTFRPVSFHYCVTRTLSAINQHLCLF